MTVRHLRDLRIRVSFESRRRFLTSLAAVSSGTVALTSANGFEAPHVGLSTLAGVLVICIFSPDIAIRLEASVSGDSYSPSPLPSWESNGSSPEDGGGKQTGQAGDQ